MSLGQEEREDAAGAERQGGEGGDHGAVDAAGERDHEAPPPEPADDLILQRPRNPAGLYVRVDREHVGAEARVGHEQRPPATDTEVDRRV